MSENEKIGGLRTAGMQQTPQLCVRRHGGGGKAASMGRHQAVLSCCADRVYFGQFHNRVQHKADSLIVIAHVAGEIEFEKQDPVQQSRNEDNSGFFYLSNMIHHQLHY